MSMIVGRTYISIDRKDFTEHVHSWDMKVTGQYRRDYPDKPRTHGRATMSYSTHFWGSPKLRQIVRPRTKKQSRNGLRKAFLRIKRQLISLGIWNRYGIMWIRARRAAMRSAGG